MFLPARVKSNAANNASALQNGKAKNIIAHLGHKELFGSCFKGLQCIGSCSLNHYHEQNKITHCFMRSSLLVDNGENGLTEKTSSNANYQFIDTSNRMSVTYRLMKSQTSWFSRAITGMFGCADEKPIRHIKVKIYCHFLLILCHHS